MRIHPEELGGSVRKLGGAVWDRERKRLECANARRNRKFRGLTSTFKDACPMPSLSEARECCPVCLRSDVEQREIDSAARRSGGMENITHKDSAIRFSFPSCGTFVVTTTDCDNLKSASTRNKWNPKHLSALLREQSSRGLPPFWLRYGMDPYGPLKWDGQLAPIDLEELLHRYLDGCAGCTEWRSIRLDIDWRSLRRIENVWQ